MPRATRVLWPLLALTAAAVGFELFRRRRDERDALYALDEMPVDDTLDQSFPASDPPSWSSAAAAPATRARSRAGVNPRRGADADA